MALPFPDDRFDAAVMALVIFFVPDPSKGVAEMARVVCPGGSVAAYAWDLLGGGFPNEPIQAELRAMGVAHLRPPSAAASRMEALRELWKGAGIEAIETREISVERTFKDFDDFWGISALGSSVGPTLASMPAGDVEVLEVACSCALARRPRGTHHLWRSRQRHQRPHARVAPTSRVWRAVVVGGPDPGRLQLSRTCDCMMQSTPHMEERSMPSMLSRKDVARYDEDGYIFVRGLFDAEETDLLRRAMEEDPAIRDHSLLRADQEGGATRIHSESRG